MTQEENLPYTLKNKQTKFFYTKNMDNNELVSKQGGQSNLKKIPGYFSVFQVKNYAFLGWLISVYSNNYSMLITLLYII